MQRYVSCTHRGKLITSQVQDYFVSYIGYECRSSLTFDWQLLPTAVHMHHGPRYLMTDLHFALDWDRGRRLPSALMTSLIVPRTKYSSIGDRAFPVDAARVWHSLSPTVTSSTALLSFKKRLNIELFTRPYAA